MSINYSDIIEELKKYQKKAPNILKELEGEIIEGRDRSNNPIPIYLTKWRIKTTESSFIKAKKNKVKSISEIKDWAGLRIICLFEQNIMPVHKYILSVLKKEYDLEEFKIYNYQKDFNDRETAQILRNEALSLFPRADIEQEPKPSGYKSVHYIIKVNIGISPNDKDYYVEIQLRTLFQDAWAELEHKLSYKQGYVHPQIVKSFNLLAKDLENNDQLISNLKEISKKESSVSKFSLVKAGPLSWFNYPEDLVPKEFKENDKMKLKYDAYVNYISDIHPRLLKEKKWIKEAWDKYEELTDPIPKGICKKREVKYWMEMEKAYLQFCEGNFKDSSETYMAFSKEYPELYLVIFRLGEIYLIRRDIANSLKCFDEAEIMIKKHRDYKNQYRVKVKLAYIYWYLGPEFIDISIDEICEAKDIFYKNADLIKDKQAELSLLNNLTYYHLEKYIYSYNQFKSKEFEDEKKQEEKLAEVNEEYEELLKEFSNLEKYLENNDIESNTCDTVSWFYYNRYIKEKDLDYLKKALSYCNFIFDSPNYSLFSISSVMLQLSHTQEIVDSCAEEKLL